MVDYTIDIFFLKSKPIIELVLPKNTVLNIDPIWKKKFKAMGNDTYHISTTVVEKVFKQNEEILGSWNEVRFNHDEIKSFYGFTKIKGMEVHSIELSKRFVNDWLNEYTKLYRYDINMEDNGFPPIIAECLYDASVYSDGTVGKITEEEVNILKKIINPDGEIITNMKAYLSQK